MHLYAWPADLSAEESESLQEAVGERRHRAAQYHMLRVRRQARALCAVVYDQAHSWRVTGQGMAVRESGKVNVGKQQYASKTIHTTFLRVCDADRQALFGGVTMMWKSFWANGSSEGAGVWFPIRPKLFQQIVSSLENCPSVCVRK